jgi:hypothetical protein
MLPSVQDIFNYSLILFITSKTYLSHYCLLQTLATPDLKFQAVEVHRYFSLILAIS